MTVQVEGDFDLHCFFISVLEVESWKEWKRSQTITLHTTKMHVWLPSVVWSSFDFDPLCREVSEARYGWCNGTYVKYFQKGIEQ